MSSWEQRFESAFEQSVELVRVGMEVMFAEVGNSLALGVSPHETNPNENRKRP